jgi:dsDNA-specific endonuclease/ATPase MutS2
MALLESFAQNGAGGSFLTMATTHHGELKTLKYSDSRFENASVEFDEEKLRPTYRLLWGIPGELCLFNYTQFLNS